MIASGEQPRNRRRGKTGEEWACVARKKPGSEVKQAEYLGGTKVGTEKQSRKRQISHPPETRSIVVTSLPLLFVLWEDVTGDRYFPA